LVNGTIYEKNQYQSFLYQLLITPELTVMLFSLPLPLDDRQEMNPQVGRTFKGQDERSGRTTRIEAANIHIQ